MKVLILSLFLILFHGCSGIKVLTGAQKKDLYTEAFLAKVKKIKTDYRQGLKEQSITQLRQLDDQVLNGAEKAYKYNLLGVYEFTSGAFEIARDNFKLASEIKHQDGQLNAQVLLNLTSSYFKLLQKEMAFEILEEIEVSFLSKQEQKKYYRLLYQLSKERGDDLREAIALTGMIQEVENSIQMRSNSNFEKLRVKFLSLDEKVKYKVYEYFSEKKPFVLGYLGYVDVERIFFSGKRDEAKELIRWVDTQYGHYKEIKTLIESFEGQATHLAQIQPENIGVILPLSGKSKNYGLRALRGIDSVIQNLKKQGNFNYNVFVRDSQGGGVVAAHHLNDLLENHKVGVVIGGLFSSEAVKIYQQARKLGIFFISLSDVYLPREKKDHLLLEIPGSIESQISQMFNDEVVDALGKKAAIIYPNSERGLAYVNEFWNLAESKNIKITDALKFQPNGKDLRDPIKNLLGLKFTRERQEEYDLLTDVYELEGKKAARRIQILKPQIDFDWVFMPAFPHDAIQLIPTFTYYDAFNVRVLGGPSWRSQRLSKESYKFKNIFFIGEDVKETESFRQSFYKTYKKVPRLIELRAYDSFKIADSLLKIGTYKTRREMDSAIRDLNELTGMTGSWFKEDGLWIKKMSLLSLKNGKILKPQLDSLKKVNESESAENEANDQPTKENAGT